MTIVHFTTQISFGAGTVANNIHIAMLNSGLSSLMIVRAGAVTDNYRVIKRLSRLGEILRSQLRSALGKLEIINTSYAMFGLERCPVGANEIVATLEGIVPRALVFYWVSYFINFETIYKLKLAYPNIPFLFVCVDDAFLTGACHSSGGCCGYQDSCGNCPATFSTFLKGRVNKAFLEKKEWIRAVDPIIIYPTTNIQMKGCKSGVLKHSRSAFIPLGAISKEEQLKFCSERKNIYSSGGEKLVVLIRSSRERRKGCDLFVEALSGLSAIFPNLRDCLKVISIGDDTLSNASINRYVEHIDRGYVARDELLNIYKDIDALIVTSREDGGPFMINECVALGVFVISTPIGVAQDLIINGENGLITEELSEESIRWALTTLLFGGITSKSDIEVKHELQKIKVHLTYEGYVENFMNLIDDNIKVI